MKSSITCLYVLAFPDFSDLHFLAADTNVNLITNVLLRKVVRISCVRPYARVVHAGLVPNARQSTIMQFVLARRYSRFVQLYRVKFERIVPNLFTLQGYFGDPYTSCRAECQTNSDCPHDRPSCIAEKCVNPCQPGVCGINANCEVRGYTPICSCPRDMTGDPFLRCRPFEPGTFITLADEIWPKNYSGEFSSSFLQLCLGFFYRYISTRIYRSNFGHMNFFLLHNVILNSITSRR